MPATRVAIAVLVTVAAVATAGAIMTILDDRSAPPIVIADPRPDATIVVAVGGAVASPGVYALPGDARTQDALAAAGGPTDDADLGQVNLARRLRDEDQVMVAYVSRTPGTAAGSASVVPAAAAVAVSTAAISPPVEPVDLNRATVAELDRLPGIGPVLAQRIVDRRASDGPFRRIEELAEVQGVSDRMVDALRPLVTVGA